MADGGAIVAFAGSGHHDDVVVAGAAEFEESEIGALPVDAIAAGGHAEKRGGGGVEGHVVEAPFRAEAEGGTVEDDLAAFPGGFGAQDGLGEEFGGFPDALEAVGVLDPGVVEEELGLPEVLEGAAGLKGFVLADSGEGGRRGGEESAARDRGHLAMVREIEDGVKGGGILI